MSTMEIDVDVTTDGEISYMKKVSSESNYDFLKFYIDGQLQGEWSGEVSWSAETFLVNAGQHTFVPGLGADNLLDAARPARRRGPE